MNLNLSNLNPDILFILLIVFMGITLTFVLFLTIKKINMEKRIKSRKIKPRKVTNQKKKSNNTWLNFFFLKLDQEYIELKLIHAGNPMGINDIPTYLLLKTMFTITGGIAGIQLYNPLNQARSILIVVVATILGFFFTDILINQGKKKRTDKINNELPNFIIYFDNYNKAGLTFENNLNTIVDLISGELKKELIRFDVNYSMTKDFEGSLESFTRRLGSADSDSLELKLRQCFYSGVYDDMLSEEKEMIEKKVINDIAKQTKKYELYLALAMGLLIFNLFLWLIYPLIKMVSGSMDGIY